MTAFGVLQGMKACAAERWGKDSLEGRIVAIQGLGKVGWHLAELLKGAKAIVVAADVDSARATRAREAFGIETVDPEAIYDVRADIFAPCALGGAISVRTLPRLTCEVIAGSANNQLAAPDVGLMVAERGILYAPDYVINAGGLMNVWVELHGYHFGRARTLVRNIYSNLQKVFTMAKAFGISTSEAADKIAERRLADGAKIKQQRREGFAVRARPA
jgi:leucine dehydrogenase